MLPNYKLDLWCVSTYINWTYGLFSLIGSVARETNLKVKQALPDTAEMHDDIHKFSQFNGQCALLLFIPNLLFAVHMLLGILYVPVRLTVRFSLPGQPSFVMS